MNIKKVIFFVLITISLLLPFTAIAQAQNVPKYVGIKEGATYIWKTEFDDSPLADYYEDCGETEEQAELDAEKYFDNHGWSTKNEGWKMYIVDLYPEREIEFQNKDYDRVKYVYNWYKTKNVDDPDAWKKKEKYETSLILEPDEELYSCFVNVDEGMSLFFIPKNLRFNHIVTIYQEYYEDKDYDEKYDADISTVRIKYFLQQKIVGISTEWNDKDTSKTESFESISKYTDDGILYYYEYTYDGDVIKKLELDTIGGVYLIENWWWIAILAGAVIIGVIVVVIVIIVKKKR